MEITQRYLHAIEFWLPKEQKKDIIAEISEDLHSQIEERQEQLGRSLNDAEVDTLLKQRGNPLLVANRYLPQRSLIGPIFYPLYVFVLKVWAICWPLPAVVVFIVIQRTQHPELSWWHTISAAWAWIWTAAFWAASMITLTFVTLERVDAKTCFLKNWNPRKLPPVRDPNKVSRLSSAIELIVNSAWVVLFARYASSLNIIDGPSFRLTLSPIWMYFFWGFLAVGLLTSALSAVNLMQPSWTGIRATLRLGTDAVGGALWCWFMKANIIHELWIAKAHDPRGVDLTHMINTWTQWAFPYTIGVILVILGVDLYRIFRISKKNDHGLKPQAATA
jgi:hypothetical protein